MYHWWKVKHDLQKEIEAALRAVRDEIPNWYDVGIVDVRLRVFEGSWEVKFGDAQFDTDHRGVWSASSVSAEDAEDEVVWTAEELVTDAWNSTEPEDLGHWEGFLGKCSEHGFFLGHCDVCDDLAERASLEDAESGAARERFLDARYEQEHPGDF